MELVLAFDIETSGPNTNYDVIAIGASVIDSDFKELDSLFLPGYSKKETKFEINCGMFWKENSKVLDTLVYDGELTYQERQKDIIKKFQEFRLKWEIYAKKHKYQLKLVSDNNVFDGGLLNAMITKHLPDQLPIPFTVRSKKYRGLYETTSMRHALMRILQLNTKKEFFEYLEKNVKHPGKKYEHDHNPAHDAYGIAYDYVMFSKLTL